MRNIYMIGFLLLVALISTLINYTQNTNAYMAVIFIMLCISIGFLWKEIRVLWRFFTAYMFNLKTDFFDKKIERPRLFIYIIFGTVTCFSLYQYLHIDTSTFFQQYFTSTALLLLNTIGNAFLWLTWQKDFEQRFVIKIQNQILKRECKAYQLEAFSFDDLKTLYNNLIENDFIELIEPVTHVNDTDKFADILFNGKVPETPVFVLNMDNIQTKYFWDKLETQSTGFTLDKFMLIFKNKNLHATRKSIETSASKATNLPKRKEDIDNCFNFKKEG